VKSTEEKSLVETPLAKNGGNGSGTKQGTGKPLQTGVRPFDRLKRIMQFMQFMQIMQTMQIRKICKSEKYTN
jgi:hypothetical protein